MPLNLSISDGDFTPYLKYNAKAGRWYVKPEGGGEEVEVRDPRLAFDMANIRTGWIYYPEGAGPEKVWDPSPTKMADRPPGPKKFKRGFEVMVFGNDPIPGVGALGLREFGSTATNCITAILGMYADYEAGLAQHPNAVPFYACQGVKPVQGSYGTNYEPQFILRGWVPLSKIPAFNHTPAPVADTAWEPQPTKAGNGHGPVTTPARFIPNARDDYNAAQRANPTAPLNEEVGDEIPF